MASRIAAVEVTPLALADPPLLNVVGVHQPWALRALVRVRTDDGSVGLGETYGDTAHLERLAACASALAGHDVRDLHGMRRVVDATLTGAGGAGASFGDMLDLSAATDLVFSPFKVASLDIQAAQAGVPVSSLLGGAVRDVVPFSAYLFYKWAGHPGLPEDDWGEALTPEQIVAQARRMVQEYGFEAIKLKAGVFEPDAEIEAIRALAEAFPGHKLRIDPNGAWGVETSLRVAGALDGVIEYLEDPTVGIEAMAQVAAGTDIPLATNMCVIAFEHVRPAVLADAVQVVLSDHHLWGGCGAASSSAGSPRRSASACRCTPTPTSASASPRWCTSPPRPSSSPTRATPITRGRPRTSCGPGCSTSAAAPSPCRPGPGWASSSTRTPSGCSTSSTWRAACAIAPTPPTCARSSPTSSRTRCAGRHAACDPPRRGRWRDDDTSQAASPGRGRAQVVADAPDRRPQGHHGRERAELHELLDEDAGRRHEQQRPVLRGAVDVGGE